MCQQQLALYDVKKTVLKIAFLRAMVNIKKIYLLDDRPIYIGYSGGKDSSVVVDLVLKVLMVLKAKGIPFNNKVYIFTSDTLVEMPHVLRMMHTNLDKLELFCKDNSLPVEIHRIFPDYQNRFFAQILGAGIPLPRQDNRWCTAKMKIMPTEKIMSSLLGIDNARKTLKEDEKGEFFLNKLKEKTYLSECEVVNGKYVDEEHNKYVLNYNEKFTCQKIKRAILKDDSRDYFLNKSKNKIYIDECVERNGYLIDSNNEYWKNEKSFVKYCKRMVRKSITCVNGFIAITGSRKDESGARKKRINESTQEGSFLKVNQTYTNSNNLLPIEEWSTKDVWNYLMQYSLEWLDELSLWNLYSDASGKGDECAFIGGGEKEVVEDGKVGCAKSRFGCWICSLFGTDTSMDGLYKAHGDEYKHYIDFREYMMKYQGTFSKKTSWALHRDVYKHDTLGKKYYKKDNDIYNPRYGMVMAGGYKLSVRLKLLIKLLRAEQKTGEKLITDEEILFIQYRWLLEGDINLTAFKAIIKYRGYGLNYLNLDIYNKNIDKWIKTIEFSKGVKLPIENDDNYSKMNQQRFVVQSFLNPSKIDKMFFPTIEEEKKIRRNWELDIVDVEDIKDMVILNLINIPRVNTLFGENEIDRSVLSESLYHLLVQGEN
ncbi:MAG: hypothetical protein A3F91_09730 [Flavobacteria bacterium RIFCSPLOWO2_12_FULL_35_11]|nr:MAG: hypothetical protein A3F91_09730 [Flavobacteria bacterium RIFCSPLOWO2_12_FULL_35_11]